MIATTTPPPGSLDRLVLRFRAQEEVRRELGNECRTRGDIQTALQMETKADAYASARRELERVMTGETPPGAYDEWPESQNEPRPAIAGNTTSNRFTKLLQKLLLPLAHLKPGKGREPFTKRCKIRPFSGH